MDEQRSCEDVISIKKISSLQHVSDVLSSQTEGRLGSLRDIVEGKKNVWLLVQFMEMSVAQYPGGRTRTRVHLRIAPDISADFGPEEFVAHFHNEYSFYFNRYRMAVGCLALLKDPYVFVPPEAHADWGLAGPSYGFNTVAQASKILPTIHLGNPRNHPPPTVIFLSSDTLSDEGDGNWSKHEEDQHIEVQTPQADGMSSRQNDDANAESHAVNPNEPESGPSGYFQESQPPNTSSDHQSEGLLVVNDNYSIDESQEPQGATDERVQEHRDEQAQAGEQSQSDHQAADSQELAPSDEPGSRGTNEQFGGKESQGDNLLDLDQLIETASSPSSSQLPSNNRKKRSPERDSSPPPKRTHQQNEVSPTLWGTPTDRSPSQRGSGVKTGYNLRVLKTPTSTTASPVSQAAVLAGHKAAVMASSGKSGPAEVADTEPLPEPPGTSASTHTTAANVDPTHSREAGRPTAAAGGSNQTTPQRQHRPGTDAANDTVEWAAPAPAPQLRDRARPAMVYTCLDRCNVHKARYNTWAVISGVGKMPHRRSSKIVSTIYLQDETYNPDHHLRPHFKFDIVVSKMEEMPDLIVGSVIRIHHMIVEVFQGLPDGRVFNANALTIIKGKVGDPIVPENSRPAASLIWGESDEAKVKAMRQWYAERVNRPLNMNVALNRNFVRTIGSLTETGEYQLFGRVMAIMHVAHDQSVLRVEDGTCSPCTSLEYLPEEKVSRATGQKSYVDIFLQMPAFCVQLGELEVGDFVVLNYLNVEAEVDTDHQVCVEEPDIQVIRFSLVPGRGRMDYLDTDKYSQEKDILMDRLECSQPATQSFLKDFLAAVDADDSITFPDDINNARRNRNPRRSNKGASSVRQADQVESATATPTKRQNASQTDGDCQSQPNSRLEDSIASASKAKSPFRRSGSRLSVPTATDSTQTDCPMVTVHELLDEINSSIITSISNEQIQAGNGSNRTPPCGPSASGAGQTRSDKDPASHSGNSHDDSLYSFGPCGQQLFSTSSSGGSGRRSQNTPPQDKVHEMEGSARYSRKKPIVPPVAKRISDFFDESQLTDSTKRSRRNVKRVNYCEGKKGKAIVEKEIAMQELNAASKASRLECGLIQDHGSSEKRTRSGRLITSPDTSTSTPVERTEASASEESVLPDVDAGQTHCIEEAENSSPHRDKSMTDPRPSPTQTMEKNGVCSQEEYSTQGFEKSLADVRPPANQSMEIDDIFSQVSAFEPLSLVVRSKPFSPTKDGSVSQAEDVELDPAVSTQTDSEPGSQFHTPPQSPPSRHGASYLREPEPEEGRESRASPTAHLNVSSLLTDSQDTLSSTENESPSVTNKKSTPGKRLHLLNWLKSGLERCGLSASKEKLSASPTDARKSDDDSHLRLRDRRSGAVELRLTSQRTELLTVDRTTSVDEDELAAYNLVDRSVLAGSHQNTTLTPTNSQSTAKETSAPPPGQSASVANESSSEPDQSERANSSNVVTPTVAAADGGTPVSHKTLSGIHDASRARLNSVPRTRLFQSPPSQQMEEPPQPAENVSNSSLNIPTDVSSAPQCRQVCIFLRREDVESAATYLKSGQLGPVSSNAGNAGASDHLDDTQCGPSLRSRLRTPDSKNDPHGREPASARLPSSRGEAGPYDNGEEDEIILNFRKPGSSDSNSSGKESGPRNLRNSPATGSSMSGDNAGEDHAVSLRMASRRNLITARLGLLFRYTAEDKAPRINCAALQTISQGRYRVTCCISGIVPPDFDIIRGHCAVCENCAPLDQFQSENGQMICCDTIVDKMFYLIIQVFDKSIMVSNGASLPFVTSGCHAEQLLGSSVVEWESNKEHFRQFFTRLSSGIGEFGVQVVENDAGRSYHVVDTVPTNAALVFP